MKKNKEIIENESPSPRDPGRRSFLNKLWIWLGIIAIVEFAVVVIAYLRPKKAMTGVAVPESIIDAGPVENLRPGTVTAYVRGKFYLCRLEDGGFLALSSKCTHLGCTVPWIDKENLFACPCHGSTFDITGEILSVPAPRPLDMYRVFIENNTVKVDTNRRIKRDGFHENQSVYAKKA